MFYSGFPHGKHLKDVLDEAYESDEDMFRRMAGSPASGEGDDEGMEEEEE